MPETNSLKKDACIVSPCVNICRLNSRQECIGCGRKVEEIANWINYSDEERRAIMNDLDSETNKDTSLK